MESSSNHKASLFKIESPTSSWVKPLQNLLNTINDVDFKIDKRSKTVYVYGKISPEIILEKITKAGLKAEIVWSDYGGKKPMGNQINHSMEQCYMNAPNGHMNYHQQQSYFPPPQHSMYPPYYQPYPLIPVPYTRQLYPQPPPPPPFDSHPKEPVAKSFPPTPAQPKNFVMGDLQLCRIM